MAFKFITPQITTMNNTAIFSLPVFCSSAPTAFALMPPIFSLSASYSGGNSKFNPFNKMDTYSNNLTSKCQQALSIARQELNKGVHETSKNDSIDIRKYKNGRIDNQPWCASFVSYLYSDGPFGYTASSQEIKRKAGSKYYAYKNSGYTPKPGDLAVWTESAKSGHIGIVDKVYSDGSFDVIEGNSGSRIKRNHYKSPDKAGATFDGFVKMNEWTS